MVMLWISTAYCQQKRNFRKLKGYKNIDELFKLRSRLGIAKKKVTHKEVEKELARRAV